MSVAAAPMKDSVQTVVIGAGIAGCSIAYHLAQRGYTDLLLVDRASIAEPWGSTGHAPGLLAQISSSPAMTKLAQCSADLYRRLPKENSAYSQVGSIEVARNDATLRRFHDKLRRGDAAGIDAKLIDVRELKAMMPLMNVDRLAGAVYVPSDGVLDARRALAGIAAEVVSAGIEIRQRTTVTSIEIVAGKVTAVVTDRGRIACERVVVAVGIWGAEFTKALGVSLPLFPVQHPYVYTEPLQAWRGETCEAVYPLVRDLDHVVYYRQHGERMGYGWYSHTPLTVDMNERKHAELPFIDAAFNESLNLELFPFLKSMTVSHRLNGIFSMTPDGAPLLGPLDGFDGLWLAQAVWVTHAGGVGKVMAEWLHEGCGTFVDTAPFDCNRFANDDLDVQRDRSLALYNDIYHWPAV